MAQSANLSKIPRRRNSATSTRKSSIVTMNEDGRKCSTVAVSHNGTYLDVPGRNNSILPRRVSKDFGEMQQMMNISIKY